MGPKTRGFFESKPGRLSVARPPPGPPIAKEYSPVRTAASPTLLSLAPEALHGPAGEFAQLAAEKNETVIPGVLVCTLVAAGAVMDRGAFFRHGYSVHGPRVFAITVGPHRTHYNNYLDPIRAIFRRTGEVEEELLEYKTIGRILSGDRLPDASDETNQDSERPLLAVGEFDTTWSSLARSTSKLHAIWRDAWDHRCNVAIMAHATETDLLACPISDRMAETASRMLWCSVGPLVDVPLPQGLSAQECKRLADTFANCAMQADRYGQMSFNASAQDLWKEKYASLVAERADAAGIVTSRGHAQVIRLAVIYALLDSSREIDVSHLNAAGAVWDYCRLSAETLFGTHPEDAVASRILEALAVRPHSQTELHRLFHNHAPGARIRATLDNLASAGRAVVEERQTRGRSGMTWRLRTAEDAAVRPPSLGEAR
jgi:hypothetical protein